MTAAGEPARLDVVRRGGLAGIPARASVELAALPPEVAAAVDALLDGRVPATPLRGRADTFTYEFSSGHGEHRRTARLAEHDLPRELTPLLDGLAGQWRIGS